MSKSQKLIITILCVILVAAFVTTVVLVNTLSQGNKAREPKFTPPSFDQTQVLGKPELPEENFKLMQFDDKKVYLYPFAEVVDGKVLINFYSDKDNTGWALVKLIDEKENVLGVSGLIKPDHYVKEIALKKGVSPKNVTAKILWYEPETYYSLGTIGAKLELQYK
jgi:hypothetical protein